MKKVFQEFNQIVKRYFFSDSTFEKKNILYQLELILEKNATLTKRSNKFLFKKRKETLLPLCLAIYYSDRVLFDLFLKYTTVATLNTYSSEILNYLFHVKLHVHPHYPEKIRRSSVISQHFFSALLTKEAQFLDLIEPNKFFNILSTHLYRGHYMFKEDFEFLKPTYHKIYQNVSEEKKYHYNVFYSLSNHVESVIYMIEPEQYDIIFNTFSNIPTSAVDESGNSIIMNSILNRNTGFALALIKNTTQLDLTIFNQNQEDLLLLLLKELTHSSEYVHSYSELVRLIEYCLNHELNYSEYQDTQKIFILEKLNQIKPQFLSSGSLSDKFTSLNEQSQLNQNIHTKQELKEAHKKLKI